MSTKQKHSVDADSGDSLPQRIQHSLAAKRPELGKLKVRVEDGKVHLAGRLGSFHARQIAVSVARQMAEGHPIVDDIVVQTPNPRSHARSV